MKKKKVIVFEGIDGSGKSSLAKYLAKKIKAKYEHNDKSNSYLEGKSNSYNYLSKLIDMEEDVIVLDRLVHTGETIYAPIYRGYDGIDYFEELEKEMNKYLDVYIIYICASEETLIKRLKERGEDYIKIEDLRKIQDRYNNYLNKTKFNKMIFVNEYKNLECAEEALLLSFIDYIDNI